MQGIERYRPLFDKADPAPVKKVIYRKGRVAHTFQAYRYYGYKGKMEMEK